MLVIKQLKTFKTLHGLIDYFKNIFLYKNLNTQLLSFDLIVSNPPYFENNLKANNKKRTQARHTDTLSFESLIEGSTKLLNNNGSLSIIIPSESKSKVEKIAENHQLFINRLCWVKGNMASAIKRVLMQFSLHEYPLEEKILIIEKERHVYTEEFTQLCKDFYLKM